VTGANPVTITIESIRVLDSGDDDDNDPGEIQIAVVLYDDPENYHRSIHATNRGGPRTCRAAPGIRSTSG
jgi:hypothetical protein